MYPFVKKFQNVYFTNVGKNINKSTWANSIESLAILPPLYYVKVISVRATDIEFVNVMWNHRTGILWIYDPYLGITNLEVRELNSK
jgi:hypothetical protein